MNIVSGWAGGVWTKLLSEILEKGRRVSPRGLTNIELTGVPLEIIDARNNLFVNEPRRLFYRFAIAEWLWIWYGYEDVATIARYNRHIAQFSDDGLIFNGSYGPRIKRRWSEVLTLLRADRDSRQAVIPIFGQTHSYHSKDVPCTLSLQLLVRDDQLNMVVIMRSSDIWLGLPYDIFNFTMLLNIAAAQLHLKIGWLKMFLGSSHLYEKNIDAARDAVNASTVNLRSPKLTGPPTEILDRLLVTGEPTTLLDPPWTHYADVLLSKTNAEALVVLQALSDAQRCSICGSSGFAPAIGTRASGETYDGCDFCTGKA